MATNKKDIENSFLKDKRKEKKEEKKGADIPLPQNDIESTVNAVYPEKQSVLQQSVIQEDNPGSGRPRKRNEKDYRKTSFDIHRDLYKLMEVHLFNNRDTIKDMRSYILGFIKADLGWKDPDDK